MNRPFKNKKDLSHQEDFLNLGNYMFLSNSL